MDSKGPSRACFDPDVPITNTRTGAQTITHHSDHQGSTCGSPSPNVEQETHTHTHAHSHQTLSRGFSPSALLTSWAGEFFVTGRVCTVHCGMFSRISGLCPLDASSNPQGMAILHISRHCQTPPGVQDQLHLKITQLNKLDPAAPRKDREVKPPAGFLGGQPIWPTTCTQGPGS